MSANPYPISVRINQDYVFTDIQVNNIAIFKGPVTFSNGSLTINAPLNVIGLTVIANGTATAVKFVAGSSNAVQITGGTSAPAETIAAGTGQNALNITAGALSLAGGLKITAAAPVSQAFGAVTANGSAGLLTFTTALAAVSTATAVVSNTSMTTSSLVYVTLDSYSGTFFTNGIPVVSVEAAETGTSFTIRLSNLHATTPLAGTITIAFLVVN